MTQRRPLRFPPSRATRLALRWIAHREPPRAVHCASLQPRASRLALQSAARSPTPPRSPCAAATARNPPLLGSLALLRRRCFSSARSSCAAAATAATPRSPCAAAAATSPTARMHVSSYRRKLAILKGRAPPSVNCFIQAILDLKKGAHLLNCGKRGKPKFCTFRLSSVIFSVKSFSALEGTIALMEGSRRSREPFKELTNITILGTQTLDHVDPNERDREGKRRKTEQGAIKHIPNHRQGAIKHIPNHRQVYTWRQMKTIAGSIGEIWEKIKTYFMWGQVNQEFKALKLF
nr:uncharacterized protein LOC117857244 isoform X6 [Setaria viridis]XP_034595697.1 uncharacterized protein LOC117857244 isoform X6 [Setaria viridis]